MNTTKKYNVIQFCLLRWREIAVTFYGALLIGLWLFVAHNKLMDFDEHLKAMLRQPFARPLAIVLAYIVPVSELLAALLIGYQRTRLIGLGLSSVMMIVFTIYVGTAIIHMWSERLPCSCGLIVQIGWKDHFVLNSFLTLISIWAFLLQYWIKRFPIRSGLLHQSHQVTYRDTMPEVYCFHAPQKE